MVKSSQSQNAQGVWKCLVFEHCRDQYAWCVSCRALVSTCRYDHGLTTELAFVFERIYYAEYFTVHERKTLEEQVRYFRVVVFLTGGNFV